MSSSTPSSTPAPLPVEPHGGLTRARLLTFLLLGLSLVVGLTAWTMSLDFFSPMVWAVALAIVAMPMQRWLVKKTGNRPTLAAGLSVLAVTLIIVVPVALVAQGTAVQVLKVAQVAQTQARDNEWRNTVDKHPRLKRVVAWVENQEGDLGGQLQKLAGMISQYLGAAVASGARTLTNLFLTLFFLFFLFRDRDDFLGYTRGLLPMTDGEVDTLFQRIDDTIYGTLYGTVVVRGLQGVLGGLMFWILGLPGALLWGVVMGFMSVIPVLGSFVVWIPAAIYLALSGAVGKGLILAAWGVGVIGSVDNVLYPTLVGDRLKMHTVPVFIAMVGGLGLFGFCGLIVGPVVFTVADTLVKTWRQRTALGKSAEEDALPA